MSEVTFLKNINQDLKIALITNANLFLMPSRIEEKSVEGFGISFIEAASYGVASIGGKDGGASDAIDHNKTGLICDGKDLNSIYDSVVSFFNDKNFKSEWPDWLKYKGNNLELDGFNEELNIALQKSKITTPNAAIAIPVTNAIIRVVTAPLMNDEELKKAIDTNSLWENLVQLTDNLDDYSIFHQVT